MLRIIRIACLLAAIACLTIAIALAGEAWMLLAIPAMIAFWVLAGRRSGSWTGSALLAMYVALAAMTILRHAPAVLVAAGGIFALAGWDLSDSHGAAEREGGLQHSARLQKPRLRLLALVVAASLMLVTLSSLVQIHLPFGIIAMLALIATGCTLYSVRHFRQPATDGDRG